jgi:hypothetical protein
MYFLALMAALCLSHASLAGKLSGGLLQGLNVGALTAGTMINPSALRCIYSASTDGFDCQSFHSKVDVGLPSIVVAKVQSGGLAGIGGVIEILGGYTPFGYQSVNDYRNTAKAFVFKKVVDGEIVKCPKLGGAEAAVYDLGDEGPVFGSEALRISLNAQKTGDVRLVTSRLGTDYARLDGGSGGAGSISERRSTSVKAGNSLLSGSSAGKLIELELYVDGGKL